MQLLVVVDTAVLTMVIEASACSEDRQTCGMREGRDVMWGGRDGREGEMVGARTFCWCYFIKRWRRSPCVEEWKLLGNECSVKRLYLPHQISSSVCKARDTQRPCSHAGHSHFQGHCQIVQFIISVSTYVHGHRLYTVKPRCLLTSAIVDFFSEKKIVSVFIGCLGFRHLLILRKQRATLPLSCRVFLLCEHLPARVAKQFRCCPVFSCLFIDNDIDNW